MTTPSTPGGSDAFKLVPAALLDMIKSTDFSPEVLEKMFKDIGASPEKLRAILNLWFVPRFRPSFVADPNYTVSGLQDVEFLGTLDPPPVQLPYRMFDIETGNLVEFPAIGARGQYCMLSHRWKGQELLLGDIKRARALDLERAKEAIQAAKISSPGTRLAASGGARKDDVQLVLEQCRIDIADQEEIIKELYLADEPSATSESFSLSGLLDRRLRAKGVENRLEWAKNGEDSARTKLRFAEMESEIFSDLIGKAHKGMASSSDNSSDPPETSVLGVVDDMRDKVSKAKTELQAAGTEYKATISEIEFFRNHNRVRDALDEMVCLLQRWKSAIKLERVIKEADRIFNTKLFQRRDRCYLWTDTCCIDKGGAGYPGNAGELSESLSLMGDWYANAEFALVQLDTNSSDADASVDWRLFQQGREREPEPLDPEFLGAPKKIINGFEDIAKSKPEWSSRAWTLQELVMSKTTFYLNSEWKDLSRPVESLGYFYHLMPFIALYTQRDTSNTYSFDANTFAEESLPEILEGHNVPAELKHVRESTEKAHTSPSPTAGGEDSAVDIAAKAGKEAARIGKAHQLVILLDALGVRFPKDMAMETATSEMSRAVYLAAAELAGDGDDSIKTALLGRLKKHLKKAAAADQTHQTVQSMRKERENEILGVINLLLRHLVQETLHLVLEDRRYVAEFGLVERLGAWQEGKRRSGFAAQSVLAASGKRVATVATDRAYALMGIMGVRFPTFSAEGYAMALARLLDQVIITHNDVSVFNWTGMEMGSPVRGRSLYPSSHVAFSNHEDRGRHYNLLLSSQVQGRMDDVMQTYHQVITVLRQAIDTVKDKQQKNLPFDWIFRIIELVRLSGFHELKQELKSVGKIVGYIVKHCVKKPVPIEQAIVPVSEVVDSKDTPSGYLGLGRGFSLPSLPSPSISLSSLPSSPISLPSPSLSMPGFKMGIGGGRKEESTTDTAKKGSRFSALGKKSSFGLGKQAPQPVVEPTPPPIITAAPAAVRSPPITTPINDTPSKPSWEALDEDVTKHLEYISHSSEARAELEKAGKGPIPLPPQFDDIKLDATTHHPDAHSAKPGITTRLGFGQDFDHESTISPNPIIVNNSGIEGLFDIQRVIVTMIDHDRLRARIAKAVTPQDKISGWCSISTGFARVIASFSCEKRLLEQELDAVEGVESKVLMEQYKSKEEKRGARLLKDMVVSPASPTAKSDAFEGKGAKGKGEGKQEDDDEEVDDVDKETEEERVVSKMIDFIQEPQLQLVAGEWYVPYLSWWW